MLDENAIAQTQAVDLAGLDFAPDRPMRLMQMRASLSDVVKPFERLLKLNIRGRHHFVSCRLISTNSIPIRVQDRGGASLTRFRVPIGLAFAGENLVEPQETH